MQTALFEQHRQLGAKMVGFAGWEMPLQYKGVLHEHNAVRKAAGLFDVSHMGCIHIRGKEAAAFLDFLAVSPIKDKLTGKVTYTVFCKADGGSIDDCLVYRLGEEHFFIVANASNRSPVLEHLKSYATSYEVAIEPQFEGFGILALQGPKSLDLALPLIPESAKLKPMQFIETSFERQNLLLSRTGYTGELGFELYCPNTVLLKLWDLLLATNAVEPCGLAARDLLRLEMGYALYGHELSLNIAPTESVAAWTVNLLKRDFLGKEALLNRQNKFQYGVILEEQSLAREGFDVLKQGRKIGQVTSGNFSPEIKKPIAIVMVNEELSLNEIVVIPIRGKNVSAKVIKLPFVTRKGL